MPRVIPSGGSDQTSYFLAREAAANDALTRLYISLLARKEERARNEAFQREMLGLREESQMRLYDRLYGPQADPNTTHPFGSSGAGANPAAPPPVTATPAPPRRRVGDPPAGGFLPGVTPQAPNPDKFSQNMPPGADAFAQATAADHQEFSAQARQNPTPGTRGRGVGEPGTVPLPSTRRPTRGQVDFLPIHPDWLARMSEAEKKYNVPQGSLLALYGYENGGGRFLGQNANSSASGLFQFTKDLRREYGIRDQDVLNPNVMIDAAAKNLRRNADAYKALSSKDLPTDPEYMPYWIALHQWGVVDGPRLVHASINQSGHMPMTAVMYKTPKRDNYTTLVNNKISGHATVDEVIAQTTKKALPWFDRGLQLRSQPQAAVETGTEQPPRPPAPIPETRDESEVPFRGTRGVSLQGVNPRLVAAVQGGAQFLPDGYTIRATSGHRPHGSTSSHHYRGNAADFQIIKPDGTPIPNKGADTTGMYTLLARGVKTWVQENDPQLMSKIGYGGAFGTKLGGGGVPDLMHFDLGGSRGRMVPEVQFARLKPLGPDERPTRVAAAQQPQIPPQTQSQAQQPAAPAIRVNKPIEFQPDIVTKQFGIPAQPSIASIDRFGGSITPPLPRTQSTMPKNVPGPTQVDVPLPRSRPAEAGFVPMPPKRPALAPQVPLPRERPFEGDLGDTPPTDVPLPRERPFEPEMTPAQPGEYMISEGGDFLTTPKPPEAPPQLPPASVPVAKEALPGEFTSASAAQATPQQMPPSATPRDALPPEFTVPTAPMRDPMSAAAATPPPMSPQLTPEAVQGLPQLPPQQPSEPSTIGRIVDAVRSGNIPDMSTETTPGAERQLQTTDPYNEYVTGGNRAANLEALGEWLKQNFGPQGKPDMQQQFDAAMQQWVKDRAQQLEDWWYNKKVKTERVGEGPATPAGKMPPPPVEQMPGGGPRIPQQPPLVLQPKRGAMQQPFQGPAVGGNVPPIEGGNAPKGPAAGTKVIMVPNPADPNTPNYVEVPIEQEQPQVVE